MSFLEWIALIWGGAFLVVAAFYWQSIAREKKNA